MGRNGEKPIDFLGVNAHLLYGTSKKERKLEFDALFEWLVFRAKMKKTTIHKNIILLGDLNLDFAENAIKRTAIDAQLKKLNEERLKDVTATCNFPLLSKHPTRCLLYTSDAADD